MPCLILFQAKLFELREELELLLNLNVWDYVKPEFEKITKEVNILIKKAKHIRRINYTTEQNLEPIEGALEGLQESLVAYEEAAKRANNPDGA
jgi:AAA+ ATPase superfamily predicted ATPase